MISYIKGETQAKGSLKQDPEANIWTQEGCEELHSLYRSPNINRISKSRRLRWAGHVCMQEGRNAFKILTGANAGKRRLGRPMRRWEDNIRMDLKEICINTRN